MIRLKGVTLSRGGRALLADAHASIAGGERVALVGRNGSGKSTLLAAIAGDVPLDAGVIELPPLRIAQLSQQSPRGAVPALDWVLAADADWCDIRARLDAAEAAGDAAAQAELHARMADIDGYSAPARAAQLLDGLGFAPADASRPVDAFSGGWKMRLNLARVLMTPAELLLLDEPTNHLDLDAIVWLQEWLARFAGSAIVVSHDREFVDAIAHAVLHLAGGRLRRYAGGYSAFETAAAAEAQRAARLQAAQQQRIAHLQSFIERFRAKATKARQAQSRMKALDRMATIAALPREAHATFRFEDVGEGPDPLIVADAVDAGHGDTIVVRAASLAIERGARIGVLGRNGAGKSTLIATLVGELPALAGEVRCAKDLRIGYFAQQAIERLRDEDTPLSHLARAWPAARPQQLRDWLGGFGFGGERADSPIGPLSGGEKSRLALATIAAARPHLLVLDEPTNHLDADARDALALALADFDGALLLVSHDRHLLRATVDRFVIVHDGRVEPFDGSLEDYRQWLGERAATRAAPIASEAALTGAPGAVDRAPAPGAPDSRRAQRALAADARRRLAELRRPLASEVQRIEAALAPLSSRAAEIDRQLADAAFYASAERAAAAVRERGTLQAQIDALEAQWYAAQQRLDALDSEASAATR